MLSNESPRKRKMIPFVAILRFGGNVQRAEQVRFRKLNYIHRHSPDSRWLTMAWSQATLGYQTAASRRPACLGACAAEINLLRKR